MQIVYAERAVYDLAALTQDEQQLLRSTEREDGDEAPATPVDDIMDQSSEPRLALLTRLVDVDPVRRLLTSENNDNLIWPKR